MKIRTAFRTTLIAVAAGLVLVACGGDATAPTEEWTDSGFGVPAEASEADRVVAIEAGVPFVFTPEEVTVEAGETITFEVTNVDAIDHDFVIGDEAAQDEHEAEMREMDDMDGEMEHDDPNAVTITAGETEAITWTFSEPGTVLYGCHEPGHYEAGMLGTITVG